MRRTHSGDGDVDDGTAVAFGMLGLLESSSKEILSQRTNAESCCTRTRGFVPTCDSSTREAVRARWARGVEPFLSRSRVFSAGGKGSGQWIDCRPHAAGKLVGWVNPQNLLWESESILAVTLRLACSRPSGGTPFWRRSCTGAKCVPP